MATKTENLVAAGLLPVPLQQKALRDWDRQFVTRARGRNGEGGAETRPTKLRNGASGDAPRAKARPQEQNISPRRDVNAVAEMLLNTAGSAAALKRAAKELASARQARSRRRFQFWLAVTIAVEARLNRTHS